MGVTKCAQKGTPSPLRGNVVDSGFFRFVSCIGLCFLRLLGLGLYCSSRVLYGNRTKLCYLLNWRMSLKRNTFQSGICFPFFHLFERLL